MTSGIVTGGYSSTLRPPGLGALGSSTAHETQHNRRSPMPI